jgi:hypothetical protein
LFVERPERKKKATAILFYFFFVKKFFFRNFVCLFRRKQISRQVPEMNNEKAEKHKKKKEKEAKNEKKEKEHNKKKHHHKSKRDEKKIINIKHIPFHNKAGPEMFENLPCPPKGWNALVIGDAHLVESNPVRTQAALQKLHDLVEKYKVQQVFYLGDIFQFGEFSDEGAFEVISKMQVLGTTSFILPGIAIIFQNLIFRKSRSRPFLPFDPSV